VRTITAAIQERLNAREAERADAGPAIAATGAPTTLARADEAHPAVAKEIGEVRDGRSLASARVSVLSRLEFNPDA